jgi:hypothetical protein
MSTRLKQGNFLEQVALAKMPPKICEKCGATYYFNSCASKVCYTPPSGDVSFARTRRSTRRQRFVRLSARQLRPVPKTKEIVRDELAAMLRAENVIQSEGKEFLKPVIEGLPRRKERKKTKRGRDAAFTDEELEKVSAAYTKEIERQKAIPPAPGRTRPRVQVGNGFWRQAAVELRGEDVSVREQNALSKALRRWRKKHGKTSDN